MYYCFFLYLIILINSNPKQYKSLFIGIMQICNILTKLFEPCFLSINQFLYQFYLCPKEHIRAHCKYMFYNKWLMSYFFLFPITTL